MSQDLKNTLTILEELRRRFATNKLELWEPYEKQREWMFSQSQIASFFAGNGVGKSETAAGVVAMHATGKYPSWWKGKRFSGPIKVWCVGKTNETTRENCQVKLIGMDPNAPEGGWLGAEDIIGKPSMRSGVPGAVDTIKVKHISGGTSYISFKSNEQGAEKLMGPRLNLIWTDEEVDKDVFDELMFRFAGVNETQMLVTFTPLKGMTELVLRLLDEDDPKIVHKTYMAWSDCYHPDGRTHLTDQFKSNMMKMYESNPAMLRARTTGIPSVGEGLVYPFPEEDIFIPPFPIEPWWPRIASLDFGWDHYTAALVAAIDPDSDTMYVYDMHYNRELNYTVHASAIKKWGKIRIAYDPSGLKGDIGSGEKLAERYLDEFQPNWREVPDYERIMFPADNSIAAGVAVVYEMFQYGKLVILDKPQFEPIKRELKLYRWDPKNPGKPIKKHNDALDALRYLAMSKDKARRIGQVGESSLNFDVKVFKPAQRGY